MNANVGMRYPVYAPVSAYTAGAGITYGTGAVAAEAVSASLNWERADGTFYGDDAVLDVDNGVLGYTIDFEPTGLSDAARAALLGETVSSSEYTVTGAASPDVGFGYVRVMRAPVSSVIGDSYEAWWFFKVKFGISSEETRTKERSTEWRVPTLQGVGAGISQDSTGKLSYAVHKTFDSFSSAQAWLKTKANIS